MILLQLFYEFFKVGLFAVGGGPATIPFLMKMAERLDWFTTSELLDMIAVSESTPGPIGINMATYCGYRTAGIPGALTATIALTLPAFLIMLFIARLIVEYKNNRTIEAVFSGIRPAVAGLILYAAWSLLKVTVITRVDGKIHFHIINIAICAAILAVMNIRQLKKLHPVIWIGVGAVLGIVLKL